MPFERPKRTDTFIPAHEIEINEAHKLPETPPGKQWGFNVCTGFGGHLGWHLFDDEETAERKMKEWKEERRRKEGSGT